jgi:hypothetical protein
MDKKKYISLVDLAVRFSKAKRLQDSGYKWMRKAPGRGTEKKEGKVGNSLAVLKAIRAFNDSNNNPIEVFKAKGYDGTPKVTQIIAKEDILRLKGFIQRNKGKKSTKEASDTPFKILGKAEV